MTRRLTFLLTMALAGALGAAASDVTPSSFADRLMQADCYKADARFTVSMPQLADDVVYDLTLNQFPPTDSRLLPCDYLIDWRLTNATEQSTGFSAYFAGHHYRLSGQRLQEYHMQWDSIPFMPQLISSTKAVGVQCAAQFVDLLPVMIGERISKALSDSAYDVEFHPDTLISGRRLSVVVLTMSISGSVASRSEYIFEQNTLNPVAAHIENNIGAISEQTITVDYGQAQPIQCESLTEQALIELYPQAFEQYRESNFSISNLPGQQLPAFSLPTLTGERYTYHRGDTFRRPTIIAILNAEGGFNEPMISDIREAVATMPVSADIIWAFTSNDIDAVEHNVGAAREGEHILISGKSLARDCGAASLPVIIIARRDGIVSNIILGYNNHLVSDVIQMTSLSK